MICIEPSTSGFIRRTHGTHKIGHTPFGTYPPQLRNRPDSWTKWGAVLPHATSIPQSHRFVDRKAPDTWTEWGAVLPHAGPIPQPTGFVDEMGCRAAPRRPYPAIARIRGQKGAGFMDRKARDNKKTQGRENHTRALKKKASPRIARIRGQKDAGYQGTQGREPQQGSEDRKRRRRAKLNDAFTS